MDKTVEYRMKKTDRYNTEEMEKMGKDKKMKHLVLLESNSTGRR
jgi:hypothetical protein